MDYKPGDVVNGHVLGSDNVWHPVAPAPVPVPQVVTMRLDPDSYWSKWLRRWVGSWLVTSTVILIPTFTSGGPGFAAAVLAFTAWGLPVGTAVNFFVATFPNRQPKQ